jgi:hypothetical protein
MNRFISIAAILGGLFLLAFTEFTYAEGLSDQVSKHIGERIMTAERSTKINCGDGRLCKSALLSKVYTEREFRPAWSDDYGPFPYVEEFLDAVREAHREGLRPEEYRLSTIEAALSGLYENLIKSEPRTV